MLNVVFFHKAAARVEKVDLPAGAEISARSGHMEEDGWETEYEVIEEVSPAPDEPPAAKEKTAGWPDSASLAAMPWEPHDPDWRDASLRDYLVERRRFEPLTSAVQAPARFTAPLPVLQSLLSNAPLDPAPVIAAEPAWTAHREAVGSASLSRWRRSCLPGCMGRGNAARGKRPQVGASRA